MITSIAPEQHTQTKDLAPSAHLYGNHDAYPAAWQRCIASQGSIFKITTSFCPPLNNYSTCVAKR